jgi:hypothetical protein
MGQDRLWRPFDRHVCSTSDSRRLWWTAQVGSLGPTTEVGQARDNDIHPPADQIPDKRRQSVEVALSQSLLNDQVQPSTNPFLETL